MKKAIYLSLACSLWINAAEVELETIHVETKVDTEVIKDVSGEDIKSADLAEALAETVTKCCTKKKIWYRE